MRLILVAMLFFVAGCAGDDKKALPDNAIAEVNIDGKELFKSCASCHKPDKDFTGPALKGSLKRWNGDKKAMYAFIRNPSKSYVENAYAKKLLKKWKSQMTAFANLTDAEIDAIMKYCEK